MSTPENSTASDDMTRRMRAHEIARSRIAELYATKNDRGYPRFTGNVSSVLEDELTLARFLLGEDE